MAYGEENPTKHSPRGKYWSNGPMSRKEIADRKLVKGLNAMYKSDEKYFPRLKGKINWDEKLVQRFLDVRPTSDEIWEVVYWPPCYTHRSSNRRASSRRGWAPDPERNGFYLKPNIEEWVKMVIEEARARMEAMEYIIRKHHESKIKIYYTVETPVPDKKKKKKSLN